MTAPIPSTTDLATRWYELVAKNAPTLSMDLRLEVETYCSGDPWADNPSVQAMGCVLANEQDFRYQLDTMLGTSYKAVSTALLLIWSLTQNKNKSWPNTASAKDTIARWDDDNALWTNGSPNRERIQNVLDFTLPLAGAMEMDARAEFFKTIYSKVMPFLPMLARNHLEGDDAQKRAELYVALGHCALQAVALDARSAQWHEKTWLADIRELCVGDETNRKLVATTIAQSDLPNAYKLRAFKGLPPELWSEPTVKKELLQCMPAEENRRFPLLAWYEVKFEHVSPQTHASLAEKNQRIAQDFCPKLYPLLELGSTQQDWCTQAVVATLAEAIQTGQQAPQMEIYALPDEPGNP